MDIIFEQDKLQEGRVTYQADVPYSIKCKRCKEDMNLIFQVHDDKGDLIKERPESVRAWPHDLSVTSVYLCTYCGSMRATWNQG